MNVLLDTCTFLWILLNSKQLSPLARRIFADPQNQMYLSAISTWEIALKNSFGKLLLPGRAATFVAEQRTLRGIESLPLDEDAALYFPLLPKVHGDPFDRILICQAIVHGMTILTPDDKIAQYPIRVLR